MYRPVSVEGVERQRVAHQRLRPHQGGDVNPRGLDPRRGGLYPSSRGLNPRRGGLYPLLAATAAPTAAEKQFNAALISITTRPLQI